MLAYSGVSHLGYILIGIVAAGVAKNNSLGAAASMFYAFVYTLTNLAAWGAVIAVGEASGSEEIKDFSGLSKRSPGLAFVLFLAMLSLAGVPPLAGFVGKFYLFSSAWDQGQYVLVIFGIINSVVSLYYYLGVLRAAYFEEPAENAPPLVVGPALKSGLAISTVAMVVVGMVPALTQWTVATAAALLS
jgi:NADH-quinone oxidoreductase subunit N